MAEYPLDAISDGMELLSMAFKPNNRPAKNERYKQLICRFQSSGPYRQIVYALGRGAKLNVLSGDKYGLVLAPQPESVFAMKLGDYRKSLNKECSIVLGMIHVSIAHSFYPDTSYLESSTHEFAVTSVKEVADNLRNSCLHLQNQSEKDVNGVNRRGNKVWQSILSVPDSYSTPHSKDGGRNSIRSLVKSVMRQLVEQGRLRMVSEDNGGTFETLHEYRVQLRSFSIDSLFNEVKELIKMKGEDKGQPGECK